MGYIFVFSKFLLVSMTTNRSWLMHKRENLEKVLTQLLKSKARTESSILGKSMNEFPKLQEWEILKMAMNITLFR